MCRLATLRVSKMTMGSDFHWFSHYTKIVFEKIFLLNRKNLCNFITRRFCQVFCFKLKLKSWLIVEQTKWNSSMTFSSIYDVCKMIAIFHFLSFSLTELTIITKWLTRVWKKRWKMLIWSWTRSVEKKRMKVNFEWIYLENTEIGNSSCESNVNQLNNFRRYKN